MTARDDGMTVEQRDQIAFEAWAVDYVKGIDSRGIYTSPYTQIAWQAWKASAEQLRHATPSPPLDDKYLREILAEECEKFGDKGAAENIRLVSEYDFPVWSKAVLRVMRRIAAPAPRTGARIE
jgi:hypothetical protein